MRLLCWLGFHRTRSVCRHFLPSPLGYMEIEGGWFEYWCIWCNKRIH